MELMSSVSTSWGNQMPGSEKLQGESREPPSSPPGPKSSHPLLSPQSQPLPSALPVQQALGEVSLQLGPTSIGGRWGRGSGARALDFSERRQRPPSPCWVLSSTGRSHWGPHAESPSSGWRPPGEEMRRQGSGGEGCGPSLTLEPPGAIQHSF